MPPSVESSRPVSVFRPLSSAPQGPVERKSRILTLDVLRGFAMLGILTVNIESFAGPESVHDVPLGMALPAFTGWHTHLDLVILIAKWLFIEGKMRALFAALFGAGCILLTQRVEGSARALETADIFLRRNLWLLLFGVLHGILIWEGDILIDYSVCGLLFLYPPSAMCLPGG